MTTEVTRTRVRRRRGWRTALIASLVLGGAGAVVAVQLPPASAATVDTGAWYVLVNRNSGKALDVYQRSTADGAAVTQWARSDGTNQQWQFVDSGGGYYRLRSRNSGKVVDVYERSTADRAAIVQWSDNGGTNQQFRLADSGSGYVRLVNRNSGKAVSVLDSSTADGAQVIQWSDTGGANQQWQLVRLDAGPTGTAPPPPPAYPDPMTVTGSTGTHDPTVVKRPNGGYLEANTGPNIQLKTSADRTSWQGAGAAFPSGAPWTTSYTGGSNNLWAPDLSYSNNRYYMYYAASSFGSRNSAIFLATSPTGASGSWTNQGLIISTSSSSSYNAIDPNLIVDSSGGWWLAFGSFWTGIKMIKLDPATGKRADNSLLNLAQRTNSTAIEAPYIFKHGSYYYLWVSFDLCCKGASSTYRIMVGRSTSVTGPYVDRNGTAMTSGGGTQVLAGHGGIHGPGHEAVLGDTNGEYLVYHYYADNGASLLGINHLGYDSAGWPYVY